MLGLEKSFRTIVEQMRSFTPTAKLLIGALMVILVMGLVLVAQFAGRAELVPIGIGGKVSPEARARAVSYLDGQGVRWKERGDELLVPSEQKLSILAQLTERELITTDQIDFESILKEDSPFTDRSTRRARYRVAKMKVVERMIAELSGIARATVVIDQPERGNGIGSSRIEPTASVTVLTGSGDLKREQADSIARMVAGAHAALKVENVTVVDARSGRTIAARTEEDMTSSLYYERKVTAEKHARTTIERVLRHIPNVLVAVNAQVDATEVIEQQNTYDDPKVGPTEERSRERASENALLRGEAGIRPNAGARIDASPARASTTSESESSSRTVPAFGSTQSRTRDPRGYAIQINATVNVPRSYFVALYKQQQGEDADDPDEVTLTPIVTAETDRLKRLVEPLIDTTAVEGAVAGTVIVGMFHDFAAAGIGTLGGPAGSGGSGATFVSEGLVKSIGLGALALVSLLLMFMMVRRAGREHDMPTAEELVGIPPALAQAEGEIVGEAGESAAAMEGLEIDEGDVRRQQMLDQINELATGSPDEAASLLRKWIRTDE